MLELFSRTPDALKLEGEPHLTPIPMDDELSSLSAILLDNNYYSFIQTAKREIEGLMAVTPECLIPLKARAWLDLTERRASGDTVDQKTTQKHKNDVFRLFQLLAPNTRVELPDSIKTDMNRFVEAVATAPPGNLKSLGLGGMNFMDILENLSSIYDFSR